MQEKQAGHRFCIFVFERIFTSGKPERRYPTAGGRRKPKACSWLEQALAPRRSRRPAPRILEKGFGILRVI